MITHGRQQILPPNMIIGRTQIQGACIGRELVIASFWLSQSALQAIVGAFGQRDGWAVIKATNAYLNQLAASGQAGKDKATALAALINEDPMLVCSLGLQPEGVTMPIRFLEVTENNSRIVTDYLYKTNSRIEAMVCVYVNNPGNLNVASYTSESWANNDFGYDIYKGGYFGNSAVLISRKNSNNQYLYVSADLSDVRGVWEISNIDGSEYMKLNGAAVSTYVNRTGTVAITNPDRYFTILSANTSSKTGQQSFAIIRLADSSTIVRDYVPCYHNGKWGALDRLRCIWHEGIGSFVESYKIYQNGSWVTWTPSTP